ncbi:unnamed protein product [Meloidogyne enterolobii]|uniref:Uncharacterized protein n=1 Tax=Meloidogyne enterolobii TaxID=390850 RepID=A0ACB0YFQ2_MELEN
MKTKSAGDFKIEGQMIFDKLDKQEKADLKLKEKLLANAFLYSKASIYELKEFSANFIGKEEWERAIKLQKSASLSSIIFKVKEFVETRSDSVISINQRLKDFEEFELKIEEKRQLEEKMNTKSVRDFKIESQITLEHPNSEEKADQNLKEKLQEKTFLSSKASIKELKEFSANFVGKEEWESTRKIQKSKSLSSVTLKLKEFIESRASSVLFIEKPKEYLEESEIKLKEKYKIKEKLNTKEMGDLKIGQNIYFEQKSKTEIIGFTQKEKIKERSILKSKPSTQESRHFQANLQGKEEWGSDRKIIKSASQSSIKFFGREFSEERASSVVFFDQRPKTWGEFEIKIKEKRQLEEKIKTKSAGDNKIQSQIIFEHLNSEEKADLNLKEKQQEKALLSSKASILEKKEFTANLIGKEEWESTKKLQKSKSETFVEFKIKEFGESRASSFVFLEQKEAEKEEKEFTKFKEEKQQLKENLNIKSPKEITTSIIKQKQLEESIANFTSKLKQFLPIEKTFKIEELNKTEKIEKRAKSVETEDIFYLKEIPLTKTFCSLKEFLFEELNTGVAIERKQKLIKEAKTDIEFKVGKWLEQQQQQIEEKKEEKVVVLGFDVIQQPKSFQIEKKEKEINKTKILSTKIEESKFEEKEIVKNLIKEEEIKKENIKLKEIGEEKINLEIKEGEEENILIIKNFENKKLFEEKIEKEIKQKKREEGISTILCTGAARDERMEIEAVAEAIGEEAKASGVLTAIQRLAAEAATEAPKRGYYLGIIF